MGRKALFTFLFFLFLLTSASSSASVEQDAAAAAASGEEEDVMIGLRTFESLVEHLLSIGGRALIPRNRGSPIKLGSCRKQQLVVLSSR